MGLTATLMALRNLTRDGWPASVREVAREAGCASSTAHEWLQKLEREGLAERHPRGGQRAWRALRG